MVPWLKIMNLKYCCIKDTYFLSLKRMEIARTSLWGFYRRKDAWRTPMTTDWEHLCGLKMIKSQIFVFRCWPGEGEVDRKWVRMLVVPFRGQKKNQRPSWYVLGPFPLNKIPEISITKAILMIWLEPLEHIDHGIFIFGIFPFLAFELVLFRSRHQLLPLPHR